MFVCKQNNDHVSTFNLALTFSGSDHHDSIFIIIVFKLEDEVKNANSKKEPVCEGNLILILKP